MGYVTIYAEPFASLPAVFENTTTEYTTPRDPSYPFVSAVLRVDLVAGAGPFGGQNAARMNTIAGYLAFDGYGPWDASCGAISADIKVDSALAASLGTSQFARIFQLKSSADVSGVGNLTLAFKKASIAGSTMSGTFRLVYNNLVTVDSAGTIELDTYFWYKILWLCGSNPSGEGPFTPPTSDSDGSVIVRRQPSAGGFTEVLYSLSGVPLYVNPGPDFYGLQVNQNNHAEIMTFGDFANVTIEQCSVAAGLDQSVPCCEDETNPTGGLTSNAGPLPAQDPFRELPEWSSNCVGGGTVPSGTPITNSEVWAV